jgi:hypothetical protein
MATTETLTGNIRVRNGATMFRKQVLILQVEVQRVSSGGYNPVTEHYDAASDYKFWRDAEVTDVTSPGFNLSYSDALTLKKIYEEINSRKSEN